jgi:hypothetical protein
VVAPHLSAPLDLWAIKALKRLPLFSTCITVQRGASAICELQKRGDHCCLTNDSSMPFPSIRSLEFYDHEYNSFRMHAAMNITHESMRRNIPDLIAFATIAEERNITRAAT